MKVHNLHNGPQTENLHTCQPAPTIRRSSKFGKLDQTRPLPRALRPEVAGDRHRSSAPKPDPSIQPLVNQDRVYLSYALQTKACMASLQEKRTTGPELA